MKKTFNYVMTILFFVCCIFFTNTKIVKASANDIIQVDTTKTSITIDWTNFINNHGYDFTNYDIYFCHTKPNNLYNLEEYTLIELGSLETSYTFDDLEYNSQCAVTIVGHYIDYNGEDKTYDASKSLYTLVDMSKIGLQQESWYHYALSASVISNEIDCIQYTDIYEFVWMDSKNKKISSGTGTSHKIYEYRDIKNNKTYRFKVRYIQNIDDKEYVSDWKTINVFEQPWVKTSSIKTYTDKNTKEKTTKIKATWYKNDAAKDYTIYLSKDRKNWKKIKTTKNNSITISKFNGKNLNVKTSYYILIRSNVISPSGKGTDPSGKTYCFRIGTSDYSYVE